MLASMGVSIINPDDDWRSLSYIFIKFIGLLTDPAELTTIYALMAYLARKEIGL